MGNRVDVRQKSAAATFWGILGQRPQTDALLNCQVLMVCEVAVYDVSCCR